MSEKIFQTGEPLSKKYTLRDLIGEGGTSFVFVAHDEDIEENVAVKILKPDVAKDEVTRDMLLNEVKVLNKVRHEAVVRYSTLMKSDLHPGTEFLVMEYIRGGSLADLVDGKKPLGPRDVATVGLHIADGLAAAHLQRVYHRDISPDNILLRDNKLEGATLIDFGIAKKLTPHGQTYLPKSFQGKLMYAPPEQFKGKADGRTDIYALGVTLIAAAAARHPEPSESVLDLMAETDLPDDLTRILTKMIQREPADRYESADAVADAFGEFLGLRDRKGIRGLASSGPDTDDFDDIGRHQNHDYVDDRPSRWPTVFGIVGLMMLISLGAVSLQQGWLDGILNPLETADPYTFTVFEASEGRPRGARGYAPDEAAQNRLTAAIESISQAGTQTSITLALGVPSENWPEAIARIIELAQPVARFQLSATGVRVSVSGEVETEDIAKDIIEQMEEAAALAGLTLEPSLRFKRRALARSAVEKALASQASCGPLELDGRGDIGPTDTLRLQGAVESTFARRDLLSALRELAGEREINSEGLTVYNKSVCKIISVLGPHETDDLQIILRTGESPEENRQGYYREGDVPVVDVALPLGSEGHLHIFVVDNKGNAATLLPTIDRPGDDVADVTRRVGSELIVRAMFPASEAEPPLPADGSYVDCRLCMFEFLSGDPGDAVGVYFVFAILADERVFPSARIDEGESVSAYRDELARVIDSLVRRGTLHSVAMRKMEVR